MTFDEYIAGLGYRQMEDGRFMSPDGESFMDADQLQQVYGADYQTATASQTQPLYGSTGQRVDGIAINGTPYQQIGPWANNSADPATALQMEIDHLKQYGVEPIYDPRYGWIAPDVSVDARVAAAHPEQNSDSIFDFGPFILGGGLAALSAGIGGLGAAGALDAGGGAALGDLGWAANLTDAAGGSLAAPEAAGAAYAGIGETAFGGALVQEALKSAIGSGITGAIQGKDPLESALQGAVLGGVGSLFGSFTPTDIKIIDQAIRSSGVGAVAAALRGQDVSQGVLTGAVAGLSAGAVGALAPYIGVGGTGALDKAAQSGMISGLTSGVLGGDPLAGAVSGATGSLLSQGQKAIWDTAKGAVVDATKTADANDWNIPPGTGMLAAADSGTMIDVEPGISFYGRQAVSSDPTQVFGSLEEAKAALPGYTNWEVMPNGALMATDPNGRDLGVGWLASEAIEGTIAELSSSQQQEETTAGEVPQQDQQATGILEVIQAALDQQSNQPQQPVIEQGASAVQTQPPVVSGAQIDQSGQAAAMAEAQRQAEDQRVAQEEQQRQDEIVRQKQIAQEQSRIAAEQQRAVQAEQQRLAQEEASRVAEQGRLAEVKRIADEQAAQQAAAQKAAEEEAIRQQGILEQMARDQAVAIEQETQRIAKEQETQKAVGNPPGSAVIGVTEPSDIPVAPSITGIPAGIGTPSGIPSDGTSGAVGGAAPSVAGGTPGGDIQGILDQLANEAGKAAAAEAGRKAAEEGRGIAEQQAAAAQAGKGAAEAEAARLGGINTKLGNLATGLAIKSATQPVTPNQSSTSTATYNPTFNINTVPNYGGDKTMLAGLMDSLKGLFSSNDFPLSNDEITNIGETGAASPIGAQQDGGVDLLSNNGQGVFDMAWYDDLLNSIGLGDSTGTAPVSEYDPFAFGDANEIANMGTPDMSQVLNYVDPFANGDANEVANAGTSTPFYNPDGTIDWSRYAQTMTEQAQQRAGTSATTSSATVSPTTNINVSPDYGISPASSLISALPGILGAWQANQQKNALEDLANKQMQMGAPSRARYESSFQPNFTMSNDPGFLDAINLASKANLHGLSTKGNPALNPTAQLQNMNDLFARQAYPALQGYRNTNASAGGLANLSSNYPATATQAIQQSGGVGSAVGGAINDVFNPKTPLEQLLGQLQKYKIPGVTA